MLNASMATSIILYFQRPFQNFIDTVSTFLCSISDLADVDIGVFEWVDVDIGVFEWMMLTLVCLSGLMLTLVCLSG